MYYSKISYEHREILLKERPKKLYQLSPKGTVPVLVTSDNLVIDESLEIMLWSLKNNSKQAIKTHHPFAFEPTRLSPHVP